jgi:hypothetical protein
MDVGLKAGISYDPWWIRKPDETWRDHRGGTDGPGDLVGDGSGGGE